MSEGEQVVGKYKLVNVIATGQASHIHECVESGTTEHYAMKLLTKAAFADPLEKAALRQEAKVLKSLSHPNIIKFRESGQTREHAYYVMELFKFPTLKVQMQTELIQVQVRLKKLIELISLALQHVHEQGWIHKDIKPDNVLCSKSTEVRVIDFSLSQKAAGGLSAMLAGKAKVIQGTRTYMAPEQIRGTALNIQTDIYNFGIMIYEMLTGKAPFQGVTPDELLRRHLSTPPFPPSSVNPNVTSEMDRMVLRMLAKKQVNRHKNMSELLAEFRTINPWRHPIDTAAAAKENAEYVDTSLMKRLDSRADAMKSTQKGSSDEAPAASAPPSSAPAASAPAGAQGTVVPPGQRPAPGPQPAATSPPGAPQRPMPQQSPGHVPPGQPGMRPPMPGAPPTMRPGGPPPNMPRPMQPGPMQPGAPMVPMPGQMPLPPNAPRPAGVPMGAPPQPGQYPGGVPYPMAPSPGMPAPPQTVAGYGMPGQPYPPGSMPPPGGVPRPGAPMVPGGGMPQPPAGYPMPPAPGAPMYGPGTQVPQQGYPPRPGGPPANVPYSTMPPAAYPGYPVAPGYGQMPVAPGQMPPGQYPQYQQYGMPPGQYPPVGPGQIPGYGMPPGQVPPPPGNVPPGQMPGPAQRPPVPQRPPGAQANPAAPIPAPVPPPPSPPPGKPPSLDEFNVR